MVKKWAYYNDNDKTAAAWARELIKHGLVMSGDVDERPIQEVKKDDVAGYLQCHFFSGIIGWPYALRLAGWPRKRRVWTGSCPCQPFSAAGKKKGESDVRHLWPDMRRLIKECRPSVFFGEQVASPDGRRWFSRVRADLEALGYAVGCADLCAASEGAPQIRQRLFFVASAGGAKRRRRAESTGERGGTLHVANRCEASNLGDTESLAGGLPVQPGESRKSCVESERPGEVSDLADVRGAGLERRPEQPAREELQAVERSGNVSSLAGADGGLTSDSDVSRSGQQRQQPQDCGPRFWDSFDVVHCTDGKSRRVEPGAECVVAGLSESMAYSWHESLRKIKEEVIRYGKATITGPQEVLRAMQNSVRPAFTQWCAIGGASEFRSAAILFAALCELSGELGSIIDGQASGGPEELQGIVREVREHSQPSCSPSGREFPEQRTEQLDNVVRKLSQEITSEPEIAAKIIHGFPLAARIPGRVGMLRGYGNSIVPQAAAKFIRAFLETEQRIAEAENVNP